MSKLPIHPALTPADMVVLAVVAEKPSHGYDLWRQLEEADVGDWAPVSKPQIYYSLKKLAGLALIAPRSASTKPAGPKREVFAATRAGRAALKSNLRQAHWTQDRSPPPFVTWAALSRALSPKDQRQQIARRRQFLKQQLAREKETLVELEPYRVESADLARRLIDLVCAQFNTELAWLDDFEKDITSRQ